MATGKGLRDACSHSDVFWARWSELFDLLGQREQDVKALLTGVPGFVSYAAFRTDGGGAAVTVCSDKAGTDESSRRAAEWVKDNVSTTVDPPTITEGDTVLHF